MAIGAVPLLYNSLGRTLVEFTPRDGNGVQIYSCGPTVYAYAHLGNMRPYVFADTLRRFLTWKGIQVEQVVNITDVGHTVGESDLGEEKVEAAARNEKRSVQEVTEHYTKAFFDDLDALNIIPATHNPRATEYIPEMIEFARVLERKGYAYRIESGLYFDTSRSRGYGRLALLPAQGQLAGARVDVVEGKRSHADFAIWRTEYGPRERLVSWDSPWGRGVPGWHLECSVMSMSLLGEHFDIHTGGVDHREIHHVNEIAQSEAYLEDGRGWVPLWMHNEFLLSGQQKISKSSGRMPLLRDVITSGLHPLAYRYFLLTAHYRQQLDLREEGLSAAATAYQRLLGRVHALRPLPALTTLDALRERVSTAALRHVESFDTAMSNDLNTSKLLAELNTALRAELPDSDKAALAAGADALLGLRLADVDPEQVRTSVGSVEVDTERVDALVAAREEARRSRDWATADRLRDELSELGVRVADTPSGARWEIASSGSTKSD